MKTFSEACESTFMRTVPVGSEEQKDVGATIDKNLASYIPTIEEVQIAPETFQFINFLLQLGERENIPPPHLLAIAFSHGVMVGVAMEKP